LATDKARLTQAGTWGLYTSNKATWRAVELMQVRVDYLREIGHPDAERVAERVAGLRKKIGG